MTEGETKIEPIVAPIPSVTRQSFKIIEHIRNWKNDELERWNKFGAQINGPALINPLPKVGATAKAQLNELDQWLNTHAWMRWKPTKTVVWTD